MSMCKVGRRVSGCGTFDIPLHHLAAQWVQSPALLREDR